MSRHAPLCCVFFLTGILGSAQSTGLQIRIVEGDHAINSIRLHRGHDPVIQVLAGSGEPVGGATVNFLLPARGAGGVFDGSGLSLTTQTDPRGMATGRGLQPNRIAGPFQIRVTASYRGQAGSAVLTETNVEPVKTSHAGKRALIIALIGGAAAGGVLAAMHGGGSSGSPSTISTGTASIVAGTPTIGPPH
ncbi:MAG TPA: hypothetical protein VJ732_16785 [Bryobacteraceae bacterium]|nr:hypothetical protein [Bryobacteraceae bacterium]